MDISEKTQSGDKTVTTKRNRCKVFKPLKSETWETDAFRIEESGDMIFIWGGGMEGCVSKRVMRKMVQWMKDKKVLA